LIIADAPTAKKARKLAAGASCPTDVTPMGPPLDTLTLKRGFNINTVTTIDGETIDGHPGTDFVAADGDVVKAVGEGSVVEVRESNGKSLSEDNGGAGGTIVLEIPGVGRVQYMHLKALSILVKKCDRVSLGQQIAEADNTGYSKGSHLHVELRPENSRTRV